MVTKNRKENVYEMREGKNVCGNGMRVGVEAKKKRMKKKSCTKSHEIL